MDTQEVKGEGVQMDTQEVKGEGVKWTPRK